MNFDDCVFPLEVYFMGPTAKNSSISLKPLVYFYVMDTMSHVTDISLSAGLLETF